MKISIGSDHKGFVLKEKIIEYFFDIEWNNVGTHTIERTDYPIFAKKVCMDVLEERSEQGVLICGSGVGMSIAANRFKNIYAALCWNEAVARQAKQDDKANVLVLPSDFIDEVQAILIIKAWLSVKFKGEEYARRLELIDE